MKSKKSILLVEDDFVDVLTVKRALTKLEIKNELIVRENGELALDWLRENRDNLPGLILLDLNMPKMNGIEFLQEIKKDELLNLVPVVVITTSKEQKDRLDSFKLNVAGYMIKPVDYNEFLGMIDAIKKYWDNSELPY